MRGENCANGDQQIHEFAGEKAERVSIELVVDVLLKMSQHSAHFLFGVVDNATRRPYKTPKVVLI